MFINRLSNRFSLASLLACGLASLLACCGAGLLLGGCGSKTSTTETSTGGTTTAPAGDKTLIVISPHNPEIQAEFKRLFETKHPGATLQWQALQGTSKALEFVRQRYQGKSKDEGIGIDVFFGGGDETFLQLDKDGLLQTLGSDFTVPEKLNGVPLRSPDNHWVAAALSGFGILYNKLVTGRDKLPVPKTWADLADPRLRDRIALADPRQSGSAHLVYEIILQANGWEKGWQILTGMAANARSFEHSSSKLPEQVANGEAAMAPAIDFYAYARIEKAGEAKLGYIEPADERVITPDPIGILRGAPHDKLAREFVQLVLSPDGQKLWLLKKGAPAGPALNSLHRMAALPALYKPIPPDSLVHSDPYAGKNSFVYNSAKAAQRRQALDDLIGAVLIDNQRLLKAKLKANPTAAPPMLVPLGEADLAKAAAQWDDLTFRNKTISAWSQAARARMQ